MKFNLLWINIVLMSSQAIASDKLQFYFNQNQATSYTDAYRGIKRPGDNLEAVIIREINKAKKTIDMAIHELNIPGITEALVKRKAAGVKVRLVVENDYNVEFKKLTKVQIDALDSRARGHYFGKMALIDINKDGLITSEEILKRDAIKMLNVNKVPKIDDSYDGSHGSGIMHHKFVVIDGAVVIQASANFTMSDIHGDMLEPASRGNQNALMVIKDTKMAKIFTQEFLELWNFKFGSQKTHRPAETIKIDGANITIKFSPDSLKVAYEETTNGLIQSTLLEANHSIDLALFVFSEQQLVNAINQRRLKANVNVAALVEPSFAYREYSEILDMLGLSMPDANCKYEDDNQVWKKPTKFAGIPNLPKGDMLHHKFGVVDNAILIYGSHNWSEAANNINDEALLVIEDQTVARAFKNEHNRLMKNATLGATPSLLKKVKERIAECK